MSKLLIKKLQSNENVADSQMNNNNIIKNNTKFKITLFSQITFILGVIKSRTKSFFFPGQDSISTNI